MTSSTYSRHSRRRRSVWNSFVLILICVSCGSRSLPEKWIIPEHYTGWLRLDYSVAGAAPLPLTDERYVIQMPLTGRLQTSTSYNSSVDRNEVFVSTQNGLVRLGMSQTTMAAGSSAIESYAVQSQFGFFTMAGGRMESPGKCLFVGTNREFRSNRQDCRGWGIGQPAPPMFQR